MFAPLCAPSSLSDIEVLALRGVRDRLERAANDLNVAAFQIAKKVSGNIVVERT